jgi:hypothetical protein
LRGARAEKYEVRTSPVVTRVVMIVSFRFDRLQVFSAIKSITQLHFSTNIFLASKKIQAHNGGSFQPRNRGKR